jgi:hypothetical protein
MSMRYWRRCWLICSLVVLGTIILQYLAGGCISVTRASIRGQYVWNVSVHDEPFIRTRDWKASENWSYVDQWSMLGIARLKLGTPYFTNEYWEISPGASGIIYAVLSLSGRGIAEGFLRRCRSLAVSDLR